MKESDLYRPVQRYLEGQGYSVHGEVKHCDIVARKGDELIIVELKRSITLSLIAQAADRKEISDSVYIAVPVPPGKHTPPGFGRIKRLLRRLEIGCLLVDVMKTKMRIRVALHPYPFAGRGSPSKRRAVIREIDGRFAEFDLGGQPVSEERITAYRQQSLFTAVLLRTYGPSSPAELRKRGAAAKVQSILSANIYGWFDRPRRGVYTLNEAGRTALETYRGVVEQIESSRAAESGS